MPKAENDYTKLDNDERSKERWERLPTVLGKELKTWSNVEGHEQRVKRAYHMLEEKSLSVALESKPAARFGFIMCRSW